MCVFAQLLRLIVISLLWQLWWIIPSSAESRRAEVIAQVSHGGRINCIRLSADNRIAASGDEAGTLKLWSVANHKLIGTLPAPVYAQGVFGISVSSNAKYVYASYFTISDASLVITGQGVWDVDLRRFKKFPESKTWIGYPVGVAVGDDGAVAVVTTPDEEKNTSYRLFEYGAEASSDLKQVKNSRLIDAAAFRSLSRIRSAVTGANVATPGGLNNFNWHAAWQHGTRNIGQGSGACSLLIEDDASNSHLKVENDGKTVVSVNGNTLRFSGSAIATPDATKPGWVRLRVEGEQLISSHPDNTERRWMFKPTVEQVSLRRIPPIRSQDAADCLDSRYLDTRYVSVEPAKAVSASKRPVACSLQILMPVVSPFFRRQGTIKEALALLNGAIRSRGSLARAITHENRDNAFVVVGQDISAQMSLATLSDEVLLVGFSTGLIEARSTRTLSVLWSMRAHSAGITAMIRSPKDNHFITAAMDGSIGVWSLGAGGAGPAPIAKLFAISDGGWFASTDAGFFIGSERAAELVNVVMGVDALSASQVFETLARSDLVGEAIRGDPEGRHKDAASKLNLTKILESGPPPRVEHIADRTERAGDTVKASVRIVPNGGGIGKRIVWRVNGISQGEVTPAALASLNSSLDTAVVTETLKLVPGQVNKIEMVAYNGAGLVASMPLRISIDKFGVTTAARPRLFVLALGVDQYKKKEYQLSYAAHDARSITKALGVVGGSLFSEVKTRVLTDAEVNDTKISAAIDTFAADAKPEDVFVLFLAGHGKSIAGRYYYYPHSLDFDAGHTVETHGIGQDKWEAWLRRISVQKSLLIIDTCEGDAFRGSRTTDTARQTAMAQLQNATGRNVLAASREAAFEGYRGHGVMTYAILEAFQPTEGGQEKEVRVTALAEHVGKRVPDISQKNFGIFQHPTRKLEGNDFAIGIRAPVLAAAAGSGPTIPSEPTHVLIRVETLRSKPDANVPGDRQLTPGTQVRAVEFYGDWVAIARDGQKIGYVPVSAILRLQ